MIMKQLMQDYKADISHVIVVIAVMQKSNLRF